MNLTNILIGVILLFLALLYYKYLQTKRDKIVEEGSLSFNSYLGSFGMFVIGLYMIIKEILKLFN